jgi:CheY-like chemotaxis protein
MSDRLLTNSLRPLLLADDDPDDREMVKKALEKHLANAFYTVSDGEELMDFLNHRGEYSPADRSPTPGLILLDLNMPKKDGREALAEIKADPTLRWIPIVVMTTSKAEEDIFQTYALGASSFIRKPNSVIKLVNVMTVLSQYWFQTVSLPN